ncbi:MAG: hypothetical protein BMS9Abin10_0033 [Gammaproteobacteria bacterium]|nr:MAG: hypothetical protein BMS9Abin10_0033 [Gammaproteobacteria bacterium]
MFLVDPRVVHQDVHAAHLRDYLLHERARSVRVHEVGLHQQVALACQQAQRLLRPGLLTMIVRRHTCASLCKLHGDTAPDTARRPCHDHDFVGEAHGLIGRGPSAPTWCVDPGVGACPEPARLYFTGTQRALTAATCLYCASASCGLSAAS